MTIIIIFEYIRVMLFRRPCTNPYSSKKIIGVLLIARKFNQTTDLL
ncbi:MAG: hypothetical protein QXF06_01620 [Archaeoglobaceae archaeon]